MRTRVGRRPVAFASLVLLLATVGCSSGPATSPKTRATTDYCTGTDRGGQVVLYSVPGLSFWYSDVLTNFQDSCGVKVYLVNATSVDLLNRLKYESSSPLADIVIAQPPYITTMADLGLFRATGLPQAVAVPADRCDKLRRWCTVVDNVTSWVYDPATLPQSPHGYDDLTGPALQGKVVTSRVDSAVDGIGLALLLTSQLGLEGSVALLRRLEPNVEAHFDSTDAMGHSVSLGIADVANGDLAESLNDVQQYGNLAVWFPAVGGVRQALSLPFAAAMVRGGHNVDNATALLAYMWSAASQELVGDAYGLPARPDVAPTGDRSKAVAAALAGIQVVRIDWQQAAADQGQLTPAWLALRHAPDGQLLPGTGGPSTTPTSLVP